MVARREGSNFQGAFVNLAKLKVTWILFEPLWVTGLFTRPHFDLEHLEFYSDLPDEEFQNLKH